MLFSVVQVFDVVRAKADEMPSAKTLFEATNTYNLNGSVTKEISFEKYHKEKGYDNPQYEFKFDMTDRNNNQTTSAPYVSNAGTWSNNFSALNKDYEDFAYLI